MNKFLCFSAVLLFAAVSFAENLMLGDTSAETEFHTVTSGNMDPGLLPVRWDDKEAFHGKRSLRVDWDKKKRRLVYHNATDGWLDKSFLLDSRDLKNNSEYTFSFYAKADRDNVPLVFLAYPRASWGAFVKGSVNQKTFRLSRKWKRYSITFTAKFKNSAFVRGYGFCFRFTNAPVCRVWIDAVQLVSGKQLKPYAANAPMNCGVTMPPAAGGKDSRDSLRYIYYPGSNVGQTVRVVTNDGKGGTLEIRTIDRYGKTLFRKTQQVKGGETIMLKANTGIRGWFKTSAVVRRGKKTVCSHSVNFAVIDRPVKSVAGIRPFFGMIPGPAHAEIMKYIGVKRVEVGASLKTTNTPGIEYTPGNFDYRSIGARIRRAKNAGMNVKVIMSPYRIPKWHFDEKVWNEASKYVRAVNSLITPESLKVWRKAVLDVVDKFGDDISEFELGGEDNGNFGTNNYYRSKHPDWLIRGWVTKGPVFNMKYDTIAELAKEIRKRKPHIRVGVVRPSQGREGTDWVYVEKVFERIGKKFDAFPIDTYLMVPYTVSPDISGHIGTIDGREYTWNLVQSYIRKYGKNQPVYISEAGLEGDVRYPDESVWEQERARLFSKDFIITRALGIYAFDSFSGIGGYTTAKYNMSMTYNHKIQMLLPALASAARVVENVVKADYKRFSGAARLCTFRKHDGSGTAGLWADKGYFFRPAGKLTVTDMMGNRVKADAEGRFALGQDPLFIWCENYDRMMKILEKSDIFQSDFCVVRCDIQRKGELLIRLDNTSNKNDLRLEAELQSGLGTGKHRLTVPFNGARFFTMPFAGEKAVLSLRNLENGFSLKREFVLRKNIPLSRKMSRFAAVNQKSDLLPNEPWTPWSGPKDLSAEFFAGWDDKYLYIEVNALDDKHCCKTRATYDGDSIQVAIDPKGNSGVEVRSPGIMGKDDVEFGIARSSVSGKKFSSISIGRKDLITAQDYEVVRDDKAGTTRYKVRIPWSKLNVKPAAGRCFGMSLILFDDDTNSTSEYFAPVGGGIARRKNPAAFLRFVLAE